MAITANATKTVSFKMPYTGQTFQTLANRLLGRDGYISGGAASDNGTTISLGACAFVQRGIIADAEAFTTLPVPTAAEPWFVLAAVPDDHPDSGVQFSATADLGAAAAGLVVAYKIDGIWRNPVSVDIAAAAIRNSEMGVDQDVQISPTVDGTTNEVTGINVYKGSVVDADGNRRTLPVFDAGVNTAVAKTLTPLRPHPTRFRTDVALLRQIEPHTPEIVMAMGQTAALEVERSNESQAVTLGSPASPMRAGYYAKRGGLATEQWWGWGEVGNLRVSTGTPTTLLAGTSIKDVWLAGQRASDDAVICLYVDDQNLKLVSFDDAALTVVDAAVTLVNTGQQVSRVRAVLDRNEVLHVVFESDEGDQQVKYGTFSIATGTFGNAGRAPTYLTGAASATNDVWPSIGVDRLGNVTISHLAAASGFEYGPLKVTTFDSSITLVEQITVTPATDVALDPRVLNSDVFDEPNPSGTGFVPATFSSFWRSTVVVTPHDEVYVALVGLKSGDPVPSYVLLYSPRFEDLHGRAVLNALPVTTTDQIMALGATSGELGELVLVWREWDSGGGTATYQTAVLHPSPFASGRENALAMLDHSYFGDADSSGFTDLLVSRGPNGGFQMNYVFNGNISTLDLYTQNQAQLRAHPRDIQLGSYQVPGSSNALPKVSELGFGVFNTRPKRMNFPFLVGNNGDFHGFHGLYEAVREANAIRGEVVVRSGQHLLKDEQIRIKTRVRGEAGTVLLFQGPEADMVIGGNGQGISFTAVLASPTAVVSSTDDKFALLRPGDLISESPYAAENRHVVLENLGWNSTSSTYRVLVAMNTVGGLSASGTCKVQWTGVALEDLVIGNNPAQVNSISIQDTNRAVLRNLTLAGGVSISAGFGGTGVLLDGIDATQSVLGPTAALFTIGGVAEGVEDMTMRDCMVTGGRGRFLLQDLTPGLTLINCGAKDPAPGGEAIFITTSSSDKINMVSCRGLVQDSYNRIRTWLNYPAILDNTDNSSGTNANLLEVIGHENQQAPMVTFQGKWGSGLSAQTFVDAMGEFTELGDRLTDDFYGFQKTTWACSLTGNAWLDKPEDGEQEIPLPASAFESYPTATPLAYLDNGGALEGAWRYNNINAGLAAPIYGFKPGDNIKNAKFSIEAPTGGDCLINLTLCRRRLDASATTETIGTTAALITSGSGFQRRTLTVSHTVAAGYGYWVDVYLVSGNTTDLQFVGATVAYTNTWQIGTSVPEASAVPHLVQLYDNVLDGTDSEAVLRSRHPIGSWSRRPLMRVRARFDDTSSSPVYCRVGFATSAILADPLLALDVCYFLLDVGNVEGYGASSQLRFVVQDDLAAKTTVLTGVDPGTGWRWLSLGWKSASEVFWGISNDGTDPCSFAASGIVDVVSPRTVFGNGFHFWASAGSRNAGTGISSMGVDKIEYRSGLKHMQ